VRAVRCPAEEVRVGAADARPDVVDRDELRSARAAGSLDGRLERLPDSHPASPRYCADGHGAEDAGEWRDAGDADERVRPLTDAEHAEHVAEVRVRLEAARAAGLSTEQQHTIDAKHKIWSDERQALHDEVIDDLYAKASAVPCEQKAVIAGGLPGSGKTTVLAEHAGFDPSRFMTINPDLIKEEIARRGLIPHIGGLSPMEASDLVHEESSLLAKRLAHRAQAEGRNVIWDVTMSDERSTTLRIQSLRDAGYTHVTGIFIDIPLEVSVRRADARYREGNEEYRNGEGLGGRYVPPEVIRRQTDSNWPSQNRHTFEQVKTAFDVWWRYDNSKDGRRPTVAATGSVDREREEVDR
jgi:predicted ABC-type ATPase